MHLKLGYMLKMFQEDFFLQQEPYITTDLSLWPQQVKFRNVLSSVVLPIRFQHGTSNIFLISKSWNWSWRRRYCQHALWSHDSQTCSMGWKSQCCTSQAKELFVKLSGMKCSPEWRSRAFDALSICILSLPIIVSFSSHPCAQWFNCNSSRLKIFYKHVHNLVELVYIASLFHEFGCCLYSSAMLLPIYHTKFSIHFLCGGYILNISIVLKSDIPLIVNCFVHLLWINTSWNFRSVEIESQSF